MTVAGVLTDIPFMLIPVQLYTATVDTFNRIECNLVKKVVIAGRKVKFTPSSRDKYGRALCPLSVFLAWIIHLLDV